MSPHCHLNSALRPASACLIPSMSSPAHPIASVWIPPRHWPLMFRHVHKPPNCLALATYGSVLTLHYSCLIFLLGLIFPLQFLSSWSVWPPSYTLNSCFPTFFISSLQSQLRPQLCSSTANCACSQHHSLLCWHCLCTYSSCSVVPDR